MTRGQKKGSDVTDKAGMPRFVDVKLSVQDRSDFLAHPWRTDGLVSELQGLVDAGYRVGCSWSTEAQSYTVSLTCRNPDDVNNGLCMTSFASRLDTAVALALWKHNVLTDRKWLGDAAPGESQFG